jgi:hypothetical protein
VDNNVRTCGYHRGAGGQCIANIDAKVVLKNFVKVGPFEQGASQRVDGLARYEVAAGMEQLDEPGSFEAGMTCDVIPHIYAPGFQ